MASPDRTPRRNQSGNPVLAEILIEDCLNLIYNVQPLAILKTIVNKISPVLTQKGFQYNVLNLLHYCISVFP